MAHRVTLTPGDGTGPELTEATRRIHQLTGVAFQPDVREAGVDLAEEAEAPRPRAVLGPTRGSVPADERDAAGCLERTVATSAATERA